MQHFQPVSNDQLQVWENKTWYDFDRETIISWSNSDLSHLEMLCNESMDEVEYWLCGNRIFLQFYRIKKGKLAKSFDKVLDAFEHIMRTFCPHLEHNGKTCKCWEYMVNHYRWVYKADSRILQEIGFDYTLYPHLCWFGHTRKRYSEWLARFEKLSL